MIMLTRFEFALGKVNARIFTHYVEPEFGFFFRTIRKSEAPGMHGRVHANAQRASWAAPAHSNLFGELPDDHLDFAPSSDVGESISAAESLLAGSPAV